MDFIQVDNPWGTLNEPPAWHVEDQRRITECGARPDGHAWTVQGEREERPWLECADCPAVGGDVYPDIIDLLDGQTLELVGRTVVFGEELPDDDSSVFTIPVHVDVETSERTSLDWIGIEYDVEIQISDRETAA